jgi:glycosyltransferase involved in cell wall biosynthesis
MSVVSQTSPPEQKNDIQGLRLLVAMPALNEAATIVDVISSIPKSIEGVAQIDVLVVDDGSCDKTSELSRQAGAAVVSHLASRGVGAAFHTALAYAIEKRADLLVTIDSDGQFNPADIPKLTKPVLSGDADFVTASRFKDAALVPEMPWIKKWGNRQMSRLISKLTGQSFHDVSCGMRCYGRRAMVNLNPLGAFTYTQEVFLNLAFKHMRIVEVPVAVRGVRAVGKSRVARNLWQYALNTSRIIFRAYRDFQPMRFFGGLALLLAIPGALLGGFLSIHYLMTSTFSPYKWTGFVAGTLFALSLILLHMGLIGDMLNRHRIYLEELLSRARSDDRSDWRT